MSKWQPIETAPKYQDILLRTETGVFHVAAYSQGKWQCWHLHEIKNPTHWMLIPALPYSPENNTN